MGLYSGMLAGEGEDTGGIDGAISDALSPIAQFVSDVVFFSIPIAGTDTPLIVLWLIVAAVGFTFYFGFINIRGFKHGLDLVRGAHDDPEGEGDTSHFQALTTALSSTVGLGNIAGVAVAISIGGPGATLWMMAGGFFGMSTKFHECTLGVLYRRTNEDGTVSGGPMYYLARGFEERGQATIGKILAAAFSVFVIGGAIGAGGMFQVNQAYTQTVSVTGEDSSFFADRGWLFGLIVAVVVGAVIIGGIQSIAAFTSRVVPLMAALFVISGLVIIGVNITELPNAVGEIFTGAFTGEGVTGGVIGAIIVGFQRAAFSNEAGLGSAPIAHSSVKTREPLTEGFVGLLEPFIDTIIICFVTASVIVITGAYETDTEGVEGIALTSRAFESVAGWFPYVLTVAVLLFALSTMIAWSYYGLKGFTFLVGEGNVKTKAFQAVFCLFVVIGATLTLDDIVGLMDGLLFLMALPNIVGLYLLAPMVKRRLDEYWGHVKDGDLEAAYATSGARGDHDVDDQQS